MRVALPLTVAVSLLVSACTSSSGGKGSTGSSGSSSGSSSQSSSAPPSSSSPVAKPTHPAAPAKPVHVEGFPDGSTVGVGMPIIATFNRKITEAKDFAKNISVTVNGNPVHGAWYFEFSDPSSGHAMEAHYRLESYWPAHAHVHVAFNLKGVSAGPGLAFDGRLTSLDFDTGPANIVTVNALTHQLSVTSDGQPWGSPMPVSLGAANTQTFSGTKVIMEKVPTTCMHDTNNTYYECGIKWDQRLTYSGEYLHAAPWNVTNIHNGVDSSNGCTNLLPDDAIKLYNFLQVGDVVKYPNASGPTMQLGWGYGDWNLTWGLWQTGGVVATS